MFLSNPVKIFHASWLLPIILTGCSLWRSDPNPTTTLASSPTNEFPFSIREPEVFQAEIVIRAGDEERHILVARSSNQRRIDYDVGTDHQRAVLVTDKEYRLSFKRKEYTEQPLTSDLSSVDSTLTGHLLTTRDYADFEELGRDGPMIRYRAHVNEGPASEVLIFFDQSVGLPVKQEFYSIEGETRTLQYSFELRGFKNEVDDSVFKIEKEFRKVNSERR
jgi:hypothetical protein